MDVQLFLVFDCSYWSFYKYLYTYLCVGICFYFSWVLPYLWLIFFHPLTFNPFVSLYLKCIFYSQNIIRSCFLIIAIMLFSAFFFWVYIPLTFTINIDIVGLGLSVILFFVCPLWFLFIFSLFSCFSLDYQTYSEFSLIYYNLAIFPCIIFSGFYRDYIIHS